MPELFGVSWGMYLMLVVLVGLLVLLLVVRSRQRKKASPETQTKVGRAPKKVPKAPKAATKRSSRVDKRARYAELRAAAASAESAAEQPYQVTTPVPSQVVPQTPAYAQAPAAAQPAPGTPADVYAAPPPRVQAVPIEEILPEADPLQEIILEILQGWGDLTQEDTNRLEVFRADRVVAAVNGAEIPKDLKNSEYARTRLAQLRRWATNFQRDGEQRQPAPTPPQQEYAAMGGAPASAPSTSTPVGEPAAAGAVLGAAAPVSGQPAPPYAQTPGVPASPGMPPQPVPQTPNFQQPLQQPYAPQPQFPAQMPGYQPAAPFLEPVPQTPSFQQPLQQPSQQPPQQQPYAPQPQFPAQMPGYQPAAPFPQPGFQTSMPTEQPLTSTQPPHDLQTPYTAAAPADQASGLTGPPVPQQAPAMPQQTGLEGSTGLGLTPPAAQPPAQPPNLLKTEMAAAGKSAEAAVAAAAAAFWAKSDEAQASTQSGLGSPPPQGAPGDPAAQTTAPFSPSPASPVFPASTPQFPPMGQELPVLPQNLPSVQPPIAASPPTPTVPASAPGSGIRSEDLLTDLGGRVATADALLALPPSEQANMLVFLKPSELAKVLKQTADVELKKTVIDTLERVGSPSALDIIYHCLDDPDPQIQTKALGAADRLLGAQ